MLIEPISEVELNDLQRWATHCSPARKVEVDPRQLLVLVDTYRSNDRRGHYIHELEKKIQDLHVERRRDEDMIDYLQRDLRQTTQLVNTLRTQHHGA